MLLQGEYRHEISLRLSVSLAEIFDKMHSQNGQVCPSRDVNSAVKILCLLAMKVHIIYIRTVGVARLVPFLDGSQ